MSTTLNLALTPHAAAPTTRVDAFLDRRAVGTVVIADVVQVITADPEQLYALAGAAWKAAQDLEQQQRTDAGGTPVQRVSECGGCVAAKAG